MSGEGRQRASAGHEQRLQQQLAELASKRQQTPVQQDVQQRWHFTQEYHFDPADCGSYPCRQQLNTALWQDLAACHQAVAQALAGAQQQAVQQAGAAPPAAAGCADPLQNPFGWVPDEQGSTAADGSAAAGDEDAAASGRISSVRPRTAQIRSRTATSLPLEFFDSPEMEQVDIQQQLQEAAAAGGLGLQALSRFYSPDGAFSWQPCTVLQYDRCC